MESADRERVAARLRDLRTTLGDADFQAFLESACTELRILSEGSPPWPDALVKHAVAAAMFLGFDGLEAACRQIAEQRPVREEDALAARTAARTAAMTLDALKTQWRP